jgi:O-antigen ligase
MIILIITLLAAFTVLSYKRLDLAVLLIIAGTPLYLIRFSALGIPLTFLEIMIIIAFVVWFLIKDGAQIKTIFKKEGRTPYPYRFELIGVLILSWLAIITAGMSFEALGVFKAYFFEPLLLFILVINLFSNPLGRKKIIWALAVSSLIVSVFAIYQKITGDFISNPFWANQETRRVVSFFGYPNAVGLFLAPLVLLFIGRLFQSLKEKNIPEKLFLLITIITSILAILFAKSEGALVGLAVAIFLFAIFANKKLRITATAGLFLSLVIIFSYSPLKNYFIEKITLNDLSGQIRKQQWIETKKMLAAGRLFEGAGLSAYQKTVAPYHQEGIFLKNNDPNWLEKIRTSEEFRKKMWQPTETYMYPHNIFLNFWSELGILGALLFCWIIAKFLWQSGLIFLSQKDNSEKFLALGLMTSMMALVIHGLVDVPYFKNDLSALFWIIIALLGGLTLKQNEKNSTKDNR